MDLLEMREDFRAYPRPEILMITEFKKLVRRDRGSPGDVNGHLKQRASRELALIYHMHTYSSPYSKYAPEFRFEKLQTDIFKDDPDWKPDKVFRMAEDKFIELSDTGTILLLKAGNGAIAKLTDYFDNVDFDEKDTKGQPIYSARELVSNLGNLGKVVEGMQKLRDQVEREVIGEEVNRKSVETNQFSR